MVRRKGEPSRLLGSLQPDGPGETGRLRFFLPSVVSPLPAIFGEWSLELAFGERRLTSRRAAGSGGPFDWEVRPRQRGRYEGSGLTLLLGDRFGFARRRVRYPERIELIVPPASDGSPGQRPPSSGHQSQRIGGRSLRRNELLIESRPYHPGDDLRRLNWKALARTDELLVRIGEEIPPTHRLITVICDSGECADEVAREARSLLRELTARGYRCILRDGTTGEEASSEDADRTLGLLAALEEGAGEPLAGVDLRRVESGVLISGRAGELEMLDAVARALSRGSLRLRGVSCGDLKGEQRPFLERLLFVPSRGSDTFGEA